MSDSETDPLICSYVIEEAEPDTDWYSLEEAAELSAVLSVTWLSEKLISYPRELDPWLASGYRKHLRRAKPKQFTRLLEETSGLVLEGPFGRIFASELHRKSETPRFLSKLQLSGFKPVVKPKSSTGAPVKITINDELEMSFGKAVIASAHAAQNLAVKLMAEESPDFDNWNYHGFHSEILLGSPTPVSVQYAQVEDFGLTEVPAGSITAIAQLR